MAGDAVIHVPVDEAVAVEAARVLDGMGFSLAEGVRVLLADFVEARRLPFRPNATTVDALEAGRRGEVMRFDTVEALMTDLHADHEDD